MNKNYIFIFSFAVFLIIIGTVNAVSPDDDILISKNVFGNYETATDGDNIVWLSQYESYEEHPKYADGKYRIILHNISSGDEVQIPVKSRRPGAPDISGRYIVWSDSVPGSDTYYDIYYYDIETKVTKTATTDYGDQKNPVIAGDIIIWTGKSDLGGPYSEISAYNISDESLFDFSSQPLISEVADTDGKRILFETRNDTSYRIYLYDITSHEKNQIYENTGYSWSISISGDRAAWLDHNYGRGQDTDYKIIFYNISSGGIDILNTGSVPVSRLKTDDYLAVYEYGGRGVSGDKKGSLIYYYDYGTRKAELLSERTGNQCSPSVSDGKIVWQDNSAENMGIYLHYYNKPGDISSSVNSSPNSSANPVKDKKTPGFCFFDTLAMLIVINTVLFFRKG